MSHLGCKQTWKCELTVMDLISEMGFVLLLSFCSSRVLARIVI